MFGMHAKAPYLDHRSVEILQRGKVIELRRIAAADILPVGQMQQAEAADKLTGLGVLDQHVLTFLIQMIPVMLAAIVMGADARDKAKPAQALRRADILGTGGQSRLIAPFAEWLRHAGLTAVATSSR